MRFNQITIADFGVFSGEQTFDLQPLTSAKQNKPVIIFGGKNGTGKTTFMEAFKVCLYGNAYRGHKIPQSAYYKYIRSRLHRNFDDKRATSATITLEFDCAKLGYIDNYLVKRSWIDTDKGIIEKLFVKENGKTLTYVNEEQWQNFLMELIPPGIAKLFFFDGEKIRGLARGKALNRHIIESINSLLGLDLIERLKHDIMIYRSKNILSIDKTDFQAVLSATKEEKKVLEEKLASAHQNKDLLENRSIRIQKEIEEQELKISTEGGGFASQREVLKEKAKGLETRIEIKKDEIRGLCAGLLPFAYVPELCQNLKNRLEREEKEQQLQTTLSYLKSVSTDLVEEIRESLIFEDLELSPQNRQLVANEAITILTQKIEKMKQTNKEPIHAVSEKESRQLLNWIDNTLTFIPAKLRELSSELQLLKFEYKTIQEHIFSVPSDEVIKPLMLKLGTLYEEIGGVKGQQLALEDEIRTLLYNLELTEREWKKLVDTQTMYDKSNKRFELAERTQVVIDEYLQSLRNEKVCEFKNNFLECFNMLFSKHDLINAIEIDEKTFDVTLRTKNGEVIAKSEFSAGERQIYVMAMIWALAKTSGRALPFIVDTPLSRLDTDHRDAVLSNFFVDASHQMIIFSTNTEIDQHYFNQLKPYIAKSYSLEYNPESKQTTVKAGYFWRGD